MKRPAIATSLVLASAAHVALAQGLVRPLHYGQLSLEAQVRRSEEAFRASERRDSGRLRELLHPAYFQLLGDGRRLKRAAIRRWSTRPTPGLAPDAPSRLRVQLASPTTAITKLYGAAGLKIVRYEEPIGTADFTKEKLRLVKMVAQKP